MLNVVLILYIYGTVFCTNLTKRIVYLIVGNRKMVDVESSKSIEPENEKIILRRHPRNFDPTETPTLADNIMTSTKPRDIAASKSSELPTMVAFDAYRDKPFHSIIKIVVWHVDI